MSNLFSRVVDLAVQIQQIPAPTFEEKARSDFVRDLFLKEHLEDVSVDALGNVFACLPAGPAGRTIPPLVVSAHLDTVFRNGTSVQVRRAAGKVFGPGIGDNSLGVASLFGLLWSLRERKINLKHDIWFVANVGEEGLGDLRGMRAVVDRFGAAVVSYLVIEGLALGHVYHKATGVRRYRVRVRTEGGHSWSDYGQPSAVHELASLVAQLTSVRLPREPRTTMNVGMISGGTGVNVIASEATCELDLRSGHPPMLTKLAAQAEDIIRSGNREGVEVTYEVIGQRPAGEIAIDHPLVQLGVECLQEQGLTAILTTGSTDANVPLSRGIPALVLGITTGGGAHTMNEFIDVEPVRLGLESIVMFVERVSGQ